MKVAELEFIPASIPYKHRELSSVVRRDGVTDVVVKVTTDNGLTGWGESCSGANVESVVAALEAMAPFVVGRDPWQSEAMRAELWHSGLWGFRRGTAAFAWAGIDMALWDICGKACGQPLYNLFGGPVRSSANYFYYLSRGSAEELREQCRDGLARGFHVFYLKVGIDIEGEVEMVRVVRETIGPQRKIRLDANGAWTVNQAVRNLGRLDEYRIDFIEQPVKESPLTLMQEVRSRTPVALSANEGMWGLEESYSQILGRTADVYCFSPYWVGSLALFQRLSWLAHCEGSRVCRHTHGEFGIVAVATHHILMTLPNIVDGNQQTAHVMEDDLLCNPLPIATGPDWGMPDGPGLGVEIDEAKLRHYHEMYCRSGQFLPYDPAYIGTNTACVA
ncbi:MAG: mandelate racemase/muconate lactonizing enzyme family protein [Bryobacteraceae bacterium]